MSDDGHVGIMFFLVLICLVGVFAGHARLEKLEKFVGYTEETKQECARVNHE